MSDDNQGKSPSEILDQSEIDKLLAEAVKAPQFKVFRHDGTPYTSLEGLKID